jgi:hypothetical protein
MPEDFATLEARLSALAGFAIPPTPDLVARTRQRREQQPERRWRSLPRLAPLAAGLGAVVLIAATILSASSDARAAVGDLLEAGGVNPFNGDQEGVYTTTHFEPRFKITLSPLYGVAFDTPNGFAPRGISLEHERGFELGRVMFDSPFGIYRPWDWARPDEGYGNGNVDIFGDAGPTVAGDGPQFFPTDAAEWLLNHPRLETSEPTSVTVGGIEGTQLDVKVAAAACHDAECVRRESVTLFYIWNPLTRDSAYNCCDPFLHPVTIYPGAHYRFIVLQVGPCPPRPTCSLVGGDELVIVAGLDDIPPGCCPIVGEGYSFERDTQPMLDSIVFVGAVSGEASGAPLVFYLSSSPSSGETLLGSARLAATGLGTGVHVVMHRTDQPYVVYLHDGSCEDLGAVAYELGTAVPGSTVVPGVVPGDVSIAQLVTTVPAALSDLRTGDFAIAAYASAEDPEPIACGDIPPRE